MAQHDIYDEPLSIFDFIRGNFETPTMQQEVDYNNYMGDFRENKRADWDMRRVERQFNDFNPTPTNMSFPIVDAQQFNPDQIVSDMPLAEIIPADNQNLWTNQGPMQDPMDDLGMNTTQGPATDTFLSGAQDMNLATKEPSFFDKIGQGVNELNSGMSDFFGDEERMARMTIALNSMRLNPDANIAKSMENKLESINKRKGLTSGVKWIRQYAMKQTDPAKQKKFLELAVMAEQNPELAKGIIEKAMADAHGIGASDNKAYEPRFDSEGKEYIPVFNPNSNSVERVYTGTTGFSPKDKIVFETDEKRRGKDIERRDTESAKLFQTAEGISSKIRNYQGILSSLDEGAITGWVTNYLPTLSANTANLESFARRLGLDVIGSVTFGALSEAEMKLAMATPIDINLAPKELRKQVMKKLELQEKIRAELYRKAQDMSMSEGYSIYVQDESKRQIEHSKHSYFSLPSEMQGALNASGITYESWTHYNLQKRKEMLNQYKK